MLKTSSGEETNTEGSCYCCLRVVRSSSSPDTSYLGTFPPPRLLRNLYSPRSLRRNRNRRSTKIRWRRQVESRHCYDCVCHWAESVTVTCRGCRHGCSSRTCRVWASCLMVTATREPDWLRAMSSCQFLDHIQHPMLASCIHTYYPTSPMIRLYSGPLLLASRGWG